VEKALKACLSIKYTGDIRIHEVVHIFEKEVLPEAAGSIEKGFLEILTEIKWVEKRWTDTRYEIETGKEIRIPSMVFKTEDAMKGIDIAKKTLELSRKFLESYFEIKIPKKAEKLKEMIKSELG
jgi:HEPN domain-containing protein